MQFLVQCMRALEGRSWRVRVSLVCRHLGGGKGHQFFMSVQAATRNLAAGASRLARQLPCAERKDQTMAGKGRGTLRHEDGGQGWVPNGTLAQASRDKTGSRPGPEAMENRQKRGPAAVPLQL